MQRQITGAVLAGAAGLLAFIACSGTSQTGEGGLAAPSELSAAPMAGGVHLVWRDNSDGEEGFEIERKHTAAFARVTTVAFDTNQFHDEGVSAGVGYVYRVRAVGAAGASGWSNEVAVVTPANGGGKQDAGTQSDAGTDTGDAGTTPDSGTAEVSFRTQVVPIILKTCGTGSGACHSRDAYAANQSMDCRGWLALEDTALGSKIYAGPTAGQDTGCPDRTLHQRLIDLAPWMCQPLKKYVVPGDPAQSLLYLVLGSDPSMGGACTSGSNVPLERMPKGLPALSAAEIEIVRRWIEEGAKDN